ncbi:hypothetical protein [Streptomyces olivochromogenes]|uniref:hypothetical protein n=1 Tax=Streptomyces olivochromogenes TaxID=1963 RepID=UPI001F48C3E7|nr:hypothetical protein [Streptomyces olivochromogenes]MCF3134418.1 hypothetical protein [Streptomyces olivochromogenes]
MTIPGDVPFNMLLLWLANNVGDGFARLAVDADLDTALPHHSGGWNTAALTRDDSLAHLLTRTLSANGSGPRLSEFGIHAYGPHAEALTDAMADVVTAWDLDARNSSPRLQVHPAESPTQELPHGHTLDKPHSRLVFTWSSRTR